MTHKDFSIGKFAIDSLTYAMYNDPLCVYREYIQNSADAIDVAVKEGNLKRNDGEIRIKFEPQPGRRRIIITDNGCGVPVNEAVSTLLSVGNSLKYNSRERGFRGIGRLGGIAYCETLIFTTKARGERQETTIRWNCTKMHGLLSRGNEKTKGMKLHDLIDECTEVSVSESNEPVNSSFFRVEMLNVKCAKDVLWDIPKVRLYLSEVAPVPFDTTQFFKGSDLDKWLAKEIPNYYTYDLFVDDVIIKKPYKNTVQIRSGKPDEIKDIKKVDITDRQGKIIAKAWYAIRENDDGQIALNQGIDSLRVRVGNILIGDRSLLNECFSQGRFNGYTIGEVHVIDTELIPNGRRDDFGVSSIRGDFFEGITKEIDIPLSKQIGKDQRERSALKPLEKADEVISAAKKQISKGFLGDAAKKKKLIDVRNTIVGLEKLQDRYSVSDEAKAKAEKKIALLKKAEEAITETPSDIAGSLDSSKYDKKKRELIAEVLLMILKLYPTSQNEQELVEKIVKKLNQN